MKNLKKLLIGSLLIGTMCLLGGCSKIDLDVAESTIEEKVKNEIDENLAYYKGVNLGSRQIYIDILEEIDSDTTTAEITELEDCYEVRITIHYAEGRGQAFDSNDYEEYILHVDKEVENFKELKLEDREIEVIQIISYTNNKPLSCSTVEGVKPIVEAEYHYEKSPGSMKQDFLSSLGRISVYDN